MSEKAAAAATKSGEERKKEKRKKRRNRGAARESSEGENLETIDFSRVLSTPPAAAVPGPVTPLY